LYLWLSGLIQEGLKGKVYATFIEKDGSLSDIKILRDIGYGTGDITYWNFPHWTPGKINDEPVRVMYSLPITIQTAAVVKQQIPAALPSGFVKLN
jgi:protein TonB